MSAALRPVSFAPDRRPLTEDDRHLIRTMVAGGGHPFWFVASVIGRCVGTVSTTVYSMRQRGELPKAGR